MNSRAKRVPDLTWHEPTSPTFEQAARSWRAALVDVADSTREQHRIQLNKLLPLIGNRRIDTLTAEDFIDVVAQLHANGTARETIRKTLGAGAMALDLAGIDPNPARDRSIKLPWEEAGAVRPPSAADVEAALPANPDRAPAGAALARLVGGSRLKSRPDPDGRLRRSRQRVRLRAATTKTRRPLWVELHPAVAEAIEATLPHRRFRDPEARLFADSGADALHTAIGKACKAAGIPIWSPHDLRHRRISLLHLRGVPWARIAEFVGQRKLSVTADTYTYVLVDETELDYGKLLAADRS